MTGAPGLPDARKAIADATRHLEAADGSGDPAVKRDRYKQAEQLLGQAHRILGALATPPPSPGGVPLNFRTSMVPSSAPVLG